MATKTITELSTNLSVSKDNIAKIVIPVSLSGDPSGTIYQVPFVSLIDAYYEKYSSDEKTMAGLLKTTKDTVGKLPKLSITDDGSLNIDLDL